MRVFQLSCGNLTVDISTERTVYKSRLVKICVLKHDED